nr:unnamed protein product [Callosobruchus analis]
MEQRAYQISRVLLAMTEKVLLFVQQYKIHISIRYIPGIYNNIADHLSRKRAVPDWHLTETSICPIFQKWGIPTIDLFATRRYRVVASYASQFEEETDVAFLDAFSVSWNYEVTWVPSPPQFGKGGLHCDCTTLASSILASRPTEESPGTTATNTGHSFSPDGHGNQQTSTRVTLTAFGGLEGARWLNYTAEWHPGDIELLQTAWRPVTLKTYSAVWKRWLEWEKDKKVSVNDPGPKEVALFLRYLHSVKQLAYNTILVNESVVTS